VEREERKRKGTANSANRANAEGEIDGKAMKVEADFIRQAQRNPK